jgi:hypothetical protein
MVVGLTPNLGLHSLLVLFSVLFFRVDLTGFLISWAAFSILTIPLSMMLSNLGEGLLLNEDMQSITAAKMHFRLDCRLLNLRLGKMMNN